MNQNREFKKQQLNFSISYWQGDTLLEASNKENKITFQALSKWDKKECQDVCEVSTPKTLSSLKHVDQSTTCERSATPAIGLKDIYRLDGRNNTPITFQQFKAHDVAISAFEAKAITEKTGIEKRKTRCLSADSTTVNCDLNSQPFQFSFQGITLKKKLVERLSSALQNLQQMASILDSLACKALPFQREAKTFKKLLKRSKTLQLQQYNSLYYNTLSRIQETFGELKRCQNILSSLHEGISVPTFVTYEQNVLRLMIEIGKAIRCVLNYNQLIKTCDKETYDNLERS